MVRLKGPLFSEKAQKQLGHNLIYKTKKGRSFLTKYNKPGGVNPFTISQKQLSWRDYYNAAVNTWGNLSDAGKQSWNDSAKAQNLKMSGWNLFYKTMAENGPLLVTSGCIVMWKGTIATIPTGWVLCNGANETPDLRDRFIVGAKQDDGGVAKTNIIGTLTQTGGLLGHTHGFTGGGHTHSFTGDGHSHGMSYYRYTDDTGSEEVWDQEYNSDDSYASGTTNNALATGITDNTNELPPYYALAFIMKV